VRAYEVTEAKNGDAQRREELKRIVEFGLTGQRAS
jgi:hypothetical protein